MRSVYFEQQLPIYQLFQGELIWPPNVHCLQTCPDEPQAGSLWIPCGCKGYRNSTVGPTLDRAPLFGVQSFLCGESL